MSELPTPDEVNAWEPGSAEEGLDPYYNRLLRAYRTLYKAVGVLQRQLKWLDDQFRLEELDTGKSDD